jgi:ABC-type dipeptide/oligopeptide/nickel transport system permease component
VRETEVVMKHALRNAAIPAITMLGLEAGGLFGRAVVVEVVFGWPGLGRLIVDAGLARDYALAQGGILLLALSYVVINLLVDLLTRSVDPRLRVVS